MTMCAAITVPIIKDGYRLYPGMPVSSGSGRSNTQMAGHRNRPRPQPNSICGSPPDCSLSPTASSPPGQNASSASILRTGIIVGGATGAGVHHQVVLLRPGSHAGPGQPQISARSSFEVGPSSMGWADPNTNRTAMSTSQLYIQKRRELCIQQQLKKQEMAKRLQEQSRQDNCQPGPMVKSSRSSLSVDERKRKTSISDPNNNGGPANPFRKLLRRLGFGGNSSGANQPRHYVQRSISECESGIEQATVASEAVAVAAWH